MSSDDERPTSPRIAWKLSKGKRRASSSRMSQSVNLPTSKNPNLGLSDDEDQTDVSSARKNMPYNMNQSIFQMLTAARSTVGMSSRFDEDESDESEEDATVPRRGKGHDRKASREMSKLGAIMEAKGQDTLSSEDEDAMGGAGGGTGPAPIMSQMLEAQAKLNPSAFGQAAQQAQNAMFGVEEEDGSSSEKEQSSSELAKKLMDIFSLPEMEEVVSEYPCWLLKSVLLQGYMYITTRHICFYAYLPRKTDVVSKSGYLSKRGKSNVKYTRYWFILKGDVLSYYTDPAELYFPNNHIDLRYGIQASLLDTKNKETAAFTVTTDQRKYYFRADSVTSAKEWVKALQKVIFRTHNEGDSVKISIPAENVIEIEESPVLEFADTIKLKVFDNDDTYAIDEYFFSFFSFGHDALNVLQAVVENSPASKVTEQIRDRSTQDSMSTSTLLRENVRATLSGGSVAASSRGSPRASGEYSRSSFDVGHRSAELDREVHRAKTEPTRHSIDIDSSAGHLPRSPRTRPFSGESVATDVSFGGESSDAVRLSSDDESHQSASNILSRSDVFHAPTMKKMTRRSSSQREGKKSPQRSPNSQVHSPRRRQTGKHKNLGNAAYESDSEAEPRRTDKPAPTPTLQDIAKVGTFPLQRAAGWADALKRSSKKMSSLLANESMGYIEKVSDMWAGGRKHYRDPMGMMPHESVEDAEDEDETAQEHGDRFRTRFGLPANERLTAVYFGYLHRVLPLYGKIYLSNRNFCFRSILPGTKTKMVLPLKDIENVDKEKGFRFGYSGLVVTIRGHEELFFEFGQLETRDDCAITLLQNRDDNRHLRESGMLSDEDRAGAEQARLEHQMLQDARQDGYNEHDTQLPTKAELGRPEQPPIVFDDPYGSIVNFRPDPMNITCLTIGSRGDVQPFIALCLGLKEDGHRCKIATHAEFKDWIEGYGIEFAPVAGDPAELMALCVEYGMFTIEFMKHTTSKMRGWLDGLLESSWYACKGSDLLIESPSAMAGIHIAEALGIPYFRAFTMPWTRTRAYPHAFAVPEHKMGGAYNYFTYVIIDNVFWKSTAGQINRWRKKFLGLPRTNLDKLQPNKTPFLYNFSPSVVIPPLDYSDWIRVTGYWFLDQSSGWTPPKDLAAFIRRARDDGKKIVYVGFGSVTVGDPVAMTKTVVESVVKADVRCILSKGWSDRLSKKDASEPEIPFPPEIFQIKSCPHDWLFKQVDAAVHHGGAGTTGASLRAGIPTVIKPFFGDQFFFGNRVEDLGVGLCIKKLNVSVFSKALWQATHNERMITKANVLGQQIRSEDGVATAMQAIYRDLEYARTLIKKRSDVDVPEESEESWTFIGDDSDAEQLRKATQRLELE